MPSAGDPIAELKSRLDDMPGLRYTAGPGSVAVEPGSGDGFPVSVFADDRGYVVSFHGWHEHFTDAESAVDCFLFGLTDRARLKVSSRCGVDYKWTLEYRRDGQWVEDSTTGRLFFPFWCRRTTRYLRNRGTCAGQQRP